MQQLHLVGFTTDHKGLILGTRRGTEEGSYVVNLDRALVEQIEELLRLQARESGGTDISGAAANGTAGLLRRPKVESRLTPREVQSLLRTGRSVGEVAEAAAMSEEWVGRFAPPILAEQARVIERATGITYLKPRIGPSIQPLGESVIWNLAERGIVLSGAAVDDAWSAFQQPDGAWVVRVSYLAERRRQHADWTVDMAQGVLKAVNRLGNELAYVEAGRRRPAALPPATPVSASAQRAAAAPPKPPPPPPLPPRPSGRLSLLGSGAGGVVRSPPAVAPHDRSGWASPRPRTPAAPGPAPAPEERSTKPPVDAGKAPQPGDVPPVTTPAKGARPAAPTPAAPAPKAGPPAPPLPPAGPASAVTAGAAPATRPRVATPSAPASPAGAPAAASPPERRARPLRPRSAGETAAPSASPAESGTGYQGGTEAPSAASPAKPADARPGRDRPLRAPSRIRRDELADPPPVTGRPAEAPRRNTTNPAGAAAPPAPPDAVTDRFGPAHSAAERKASTAERFRVGAGGTGLASGPPATAGAPAPPAPVAVADQPEVDAAAEPAPARDSVRDRRSGSGSGSGAGRPLRARPLRAQRVVDPGLDTPAAWESGAESGQWDPAAAPNADDVYQAFANLSHEDPITAPVPAVDLVERDLDVVDHPGVDMPGSDQVLIRAGQAGAPVQAGGRPLAKGSGAADDRRARPGRLKLRRRPQASP